MAALSELSICVRDLLGDPAAQSNTWTPEQVTYAVNQAVLNYCTKKHVTYKETIIAVDATGIVNLPATAFTVERVFVN